MIKIPRKYRKRFKKYGFAKITLSEDHVKYVLTENSRFINRVLDTDLFIEIKKLGENYLWIGHNKYCVHYDMEMSINIGNEREVFKSFRGLITRLSNTLRLRCYMIPARKSKWEFADHWHSRHLKDGYFD